MGAIEHEHVCTFVRFVRYWSTFQQVPKGTKIRSAIVVVVEEKEEVVVQ